jgi:mannose-6-phosphate isomerase-like protein (cupin superfamily)
VTAESVRSQAGHKLIDEASQTAVWLLGGLAQVRVPGSATRDTYTLVEHSGARGYNSPQHIHHYEDEAFFVLDGTLRMLCGEDDVLVESGSTMIVPQQIPHGFIVTSAKARFFTIHCTPAPDRRPQFDRFLAAELPAAAELALPPPSVPMDLQRLVSLGDEYGFTRVGPPPDL